MEITYVYRQPESFSLLSLHPSKPDGIERAHPWPLKLCDVDSRRRSTIKKPSSPTSCDEDPTTAFSELVCLLATTPGASKTKQKIGKDVINRSQLSEFRRFS